MTKIPFFCKLPERVSTGQGHSWKLHFRPLKIQTTTPSHRPATKVEATQSKELKELESKLYLKSECKRKSV